MTEGWIKLHRKITEWEWYDDTNTFRLFIHLLLTANHEEKQWHGVTIGRGQKITSLSHLAEELHLTVKKVRVSLDKLKKTGEVASKANNKFTVLTIINYSRYQENGTPEGNLGANKGQTKGNKQELKNKKKILDKSNRSLKNDQVEFVLKEFERVTGFRPTDKQPRRVAWNYIQRAKTEIKKFGRNPDDETFIRFTTKYFDWLSKQQWFEHCEKLETIKLKLVKYLDLFGGKNDPKSSGPNQQAAGKFSAQA